jgi:hypothetical protein
MYRRDRPKIPTFEATEHLYLRYGREHFVNGRLDVKAIRAQLQQSVNRGSLSEPEDVLFSESGRYNGLGVVGFMAAEIPPLVKQEVGPAYSFLLSHEPLDNNYSHSEIWSDHDPATGKFRRPNTAVSLKFRIRLCMVITEERIKIRAVRENSGPAIDASKEI